MFVKQSERRLKMYDTIKRLADEKGYSIAALEKAAGLSNGTIGKWRESAEGVRVSSIKALADVLEVSVDEIVNGKEAK